MLPASDFNLQPRRSLPSASCVDTMSRPSAVARSGTPDSVMSEMEEEDAPDDFGELLAEVGLLRTKSSWSEVAAVPSDSLTDLIQMENQTDGVRKVRSAAGALLPRTADPCTLSYRMVSACWLS